MPVYEFVARRDRPEFYQESGSMIASDSRDAIDILKEDQYHDIRLHRLSGLESVWKRLTADMR